MVAVPGLGDVRQEYRFLGADLLKRGFHVVTMDLRGHGESSTGFADMTVEAHACDVIALVKHLDAGRTIVIGTSFGAAVAAHAAVIAPELVEKVLVIGPFVRDAPPSPLMSAMLGVLFGGPWGRAAWMSYFDSLFPTKKPADYEQYRAALKKNLSEPGRFDAVRSLLGAGRKRTATRLGEVKCPVLVVMGTKDPDFKSPADEAQLVAQALHGEVVLIDGAGHYPHVEMPDATTPAILRFLEAR